MLWFIALLNLHFLASLGWEHWPAGRRFESHNSYPWPWTLHFSSLIHKHVFDEWMVMVGHSLMGFTLVISDLNWTARIEPGLLSWHTSSLTTELQEVSQAISWPGNSEVPQPTVLLVALDQNTYPQVAGSNPFIAISDHGPCITAGWYISM